MELLAGEACSFCGKAAKDVRGLAGRPDVHTRICNECVDLCVAILAERQPQPPQAEGPEVPLFTCSFCGRSHRAVGYLITGPRVFICDDCTRATVSLFQ